MKVVTLNLWNGGRLLPAAREFLREQNADIMFLQEVYNGSGVEKEDRYRTVEILQADFPEYHAAFSAIYLDTSTPYGELDDGQLILSRWPLTQLERAYVKSGYGPFDQEGTTDFSSFPAAFQKATVTISGKEITLINVHGPVNLDGLADDESRQIMRTKILEHVTEYTIVAGDFNARAESETFRVLEQQLQNPFLGQLSTTFNVSRKDLVRFPGYATSAVDCIFLTPTFKVLQREQPQVDVSDHLPLVAMISLE
jgi:endonuclease/exonuclease/phosphatase family metal-dependent hydrolase